MYKLIMLVFLTLFLSSPSFAQDQDMPPDEANSPSCETIANACLNAGFSRDGSQGKMFWHDCMKPILFGKEVSGVTVDAKDVKDCRKFKIKNLQEQLNQLKKYQNK